MELSNFQVCDRDLDEETLSLYLSSNTIAVDTETMGLVIGRDRLCLVQLCDTKGFVTAIRIAKGQTSAPNLKRLMEATEIVKVFHYARFDLAQLNHTFSIQTQPVFCTKIASKLARTYTNSHGLKSLVLELTGIELDKSSQTSDWGNVSNLKDTQLNYAANDVCYLIDIRQKLIDMLEREDRWELAQSCFECLPTIVSLDLLRYKDIFEH